MKVTRKKSEKENTNYIKLQVIAIFFYHCKTDGWLRNSFGKEALEPVSDT